MMAMKETEIGPNNTVRLGVAVSVGMAIFGVLLSAVTLAVNANAKISALSVSLLDSTARQIRIETKVDELADKLDANTRDTISRLATLEAQMKVVQSAQPK